MGGAVIGADFFISGCKPSGGQVAGLFDADHVDYLNEIAETILPETSSPGAKAANVGQFIAVMVRDCYTPADQKTFMEGLTKLDDAAQEHFHAKFISLNPQQRTGLLISLDKEQKDFYKEQDKQIAAEAAKHKDDKNWELGGMPNHYFRMVKELTLLGYFTSKDGATKALRYVETPGRFDACLPYKKGEKAWLEDF
jgi:hypothetical protein